MNLAFANNGDQELVSGSGVLATITMKGTSADAIDLSSIMIIGPDFSFETLETSSGPVTPELSEGNITKYARSDIKDITMTNDLLKTDDGDNVKKLVQTRTYDKLFNGGYERNDFEFLWTYGDGTVVLEDYVKVPTTMHIEMNEAVDMNEVSVFNANKGNGYLEKAAVTLTYEGDGGKSDPIVIEEDTAEFKFSFDTAGKKVVAVDIEFMETSGKVADVDKSENSSAENRMLTITEIELKYNDYKAVTGISADGNKKELAVDETADITATFTPADATNPYFTAASSDASVAEVVVVADDDGYAKYQVKGVSTGTAKITLTALEDETITATYDVTVTGGGEAQSTEIDHTKISATVDAYSESNTADRLTDGDLTTYWESPYGGDNAKLPKSIVLDLGASYVLDKVQLISFKSLNGGVTAYEIYTSTDGQEWSTEAVKGSVSADTYDYSNVIVEKALDNVTARYVKITVTEATSWDGDASKGLYARIAEVKVWGVAAQ